MKIKYYYERLLNFLSRHLAKDKLLHGYLAGIIYPIILISLALLPITLTFAVILAVVIMGVIAFGKEYLDKLSTRHTSDIYDAFYTLSLPVLFSITILILNKIYG